MTFDTERNVTSGTTATVRWAARIRDLWVLWRAPILTLVALHAAVTAVLRLIGAFDALALGPEGPVDLMIRRGEVLRWFQGVTIYEEPTSADYPPGSYALLWTLVGWLPEMPARAFFAATVVASLAVTAWVGVLASRARGRATQAFAALFVAPLGVTMITVYLGQLGLHVLACLVAAAWLLLGAGGRDGPGRDARRETWAGDLAVAALLAFSLIKPTLSVPVVVALLILCGRWRPTLLTVATYGAVFLVAAAFQDPSPVELAFLWLGRESILDMRWGSINIHLWLHWMGVEGSRLPASLVVLLLSSGWVWRYRRVDPWLVAGVAALVGRLWIHHRAYDDVLLFMTVIPLLRIAREGEEGDPTVPVLAGVLVFLMYGFGHAPYHYLSREFMDLWVFAEAGRTVVWAGVLAFLLWQAHRRDPSPGELRAPA